jgi:hypothetical protein
MFAPTSANLKLTDRAVREVTLDRLTKHLPLQVEGWACTTETVLDVLVKAAATGKTIEAVCKELFHLTKIGLHLSLD